MRELTRLRAYNLAKSLKRRLKRSSKLAGERAQAPKPRSQIPYYSTLRIATLNVCGLGDAAKRKELVDIMHKEHLDILCIQETKVNTSNHLNWSGVHCYTSSGVDHADIAAWEAIRHTPTTRRPYT